MVHSFLENFDGISPKNGGTILLNTCWVKSRFGSFHWKGNQTIIYSKNKQYTSYSAGDSESPAE
jgi:hypothetical protein